MIIALTGYMGSGKSSLGKHLAKKLAMPFIDLDRYVEENFGFPPGKIITKFGEDFFRKIEHQSLKAILWQFKNKHLVIALGGGTFLFDNNYEILRRNAYTIFIDTPFEQIKRRLQNSNEYRPLLYRNENEEIDWETVKNHYLKRKNKYRMADCVFHNHYSDALEAAKKLLEQIKNEENV